ncbi:hypothetical protein, partial [Afipia sp. OHSU_II-C2]|uniref:hypothetical protein n=1 Tax=Afipia sp. OHSU_II-C2 TaxID=1297861 RepID=UPI0019553F93
AHLGTPHAPGGRTRPDLPASNPHPLGDPSNAPLTAINTMIYIGNIEILTAKSAIYLGNVG